MALVTRVSRLFRADMHAVLDRIEEPQQLLQQAIREMEEALLQEEQQLKLMQHEQGQLQRRLQGLEQDLAKSEEELDLCFESNKEELARNIIKRRLETERLGNQLAEKGEALVERIRQLEPRIEQNRDELQGMRQKAELLASEHPDSFVGESVQSSDVVIREEEIEVAFLREKQRRMPS
ncbi:MAG: PspA/IM30 family protein [Pseudomonadota bacterium]